MNKILTVMGVIGIALVISYSWPVPKQNFAELYEKVAPQKKRSLLAFREQYPPELIRVGTYDWEYLVTGKGEQTILFLHGMTGAFDIWWQQMAKLSRHFKVISVTYPPVNTMADMSRGIVSILDTEKISKVNVVGSSLGGYLVQYLMANYPERIYKAVLGNTFPPNDVLRKKNELIIGILPFLPDWLVMNKFRSNFMKVIYPSSDHSELVLAYMLEQISGRMTKAQVTARAKAVIESFEPVMAGIPVMIIESDNDPLVEASLRVQLKSTYASSEKHTLHDAGHFPYLNKPDRYTDLIVSFFEK